MNKTEPLNSHVISPNDFGRSLVSVNDAFGFFYKQIGPNERPFVAEITELNNAMLEEWKETVLKKLANSDGLAEAELVSISLKVFIEGHEIRSLNEKYHFDDCPNDAEFLQRPEFLDYLEKATLKELWELRTTRLMLSYQDIADRIKLNLAFQRYKKVISKSDDPFQWYVLSKKHKDLFIGGYLPFDLTAEKLQAITEKISTVMMNKINPY